MTFKIIAEAELEKRLGEISFKSRSMEKACLERKRTMMMNLFWNRPRADRGPFEMSKTSTWTTTWVQEQGQKLTLLDD